MRIKDKISSRKTDGKDYVLLTGATGLLGRYLVRDLLMRGYRLAVVVRPCKRFTARQRMESILQQWESEQGIFLPRPVILEGDVRLPSLGLSEKDAAWAAERCYAMFHSAAILAFFGSDREREPWVTNVGGTRNVIDFCKSAKIRELHYVSTAYVCGNRQDSVSENELDAGQEFRNDYEKSKFESETMVHAAEHFDKKTIYRPAVIAGDSETGYTSTYHGLHLYLRLMALLVPSQPADPQGVRRTEIRLPMSGDEPRNIVPVDWVSKTIAHLFDNESAHGRTFHLVPDEPVTPRLVVDSCYQFFNSTGVEYLGSDEFPLDASNPFEARFLESVSMYRSYDRTDPEFCTANLRLYAGHLPCPPIDNEMIHRYLQFGEEDNWGKRKPQAPEIELIAEDYFDVVSRVVTRFLSSNEYNQVVGQRHHGLSKSGSRSLQNTITSKDLLLGLDVLGAGGGQWHIIVAPSGKCSIERGLPPGQAPVLKMDINEFARLFDRAFMEGEREPIELTGYSRFAFASLAQALMTPN
jgi:thioester reductase-like protein